MSEPTATAPAPQIRVLITGSRDFTSRHIVASALQMVAREHGYAHMVVVHGAARGADRIAAGVAADNPAYLTGEPHPAKWQRADGSTNRGAGFARNAEMVGLGADICLAFLKADAGNRGTRHCIAQAERAGIPVHQFWEVP